MTTRFTLFPLLVFIGLCAVLFCMLTANWSWGARAFFGGCFVLCWPLLLKTLLAPKVHRVVASLLVILGMACCYFWIRKPEQFAEQFAKDPGSWYVEIAGTDKFEVHGHRRNLGQLLSGEFQFDIGWNGRPAFPVWATSHGGPMKLPPPLEPEPQRKGPVWVGMYPPANPFEH